MDCLGYKLVTAPTVEPVSATEMRAYLRLADTSQDDMLDALIASARAQLEQTTGRIFGASVYDVLFEDFDEDAECPELVFPVTPVSSVTSIYYDVSGVATLLAASQYELSDYALFPKVVPAYSVSWPSADSDSVIVKVSAGTASDYDKIGCGLIKAIVADLFEHPESNIETALSENRSIERMMNVFRTR